MNTTTIHNLDLKSAKTRLLNEPDHPLVITAKEYDGIEFVTLLKFEVGLVNLWGSDWLLFDYNAGAQLYRRENSKKMIRAIPGSKPSESFFGLEKMNSHSKLIIAKSPREAMLLDQLMGDEYSVLGLTSGEVGTLSSAQKKCLEFALPSIEKIFVFLDTDNTNSKLISSMLSKDISKNTNKATHQVNITKASNGKYKDITEAIQNGEDKTFIQDSMDQAELIDPAATAKTAEASNLNLVASPFDSYKPSELPQYIYEELPEILGKSLRLIKGSNKRDVFLLSALPIISAHLNNILIETEEGLITPDLFTMVIAPPASGKGIANKARKIGESLNNHFQTVYKKDLELWKDLKKNNPSLERPKPKMLYFPANSSSRAMYDSLESNNGRGIIFESEIDAMVDSFNQDWGNFSTLTRQAFHHENVSLNRKDDFFSLSNPALSIFLSGTHDQFLSLFKSPDNGLFSRFLFYTFESDKVWESQRATKQSRELELHINDLSELLKDLYLFLSQRKPLSISISEYQLDRIDEYFADRTLDLVKEDYSDHHHSLLRRSGVILNRIIAIISSIRILNNLGLKGFDRSTIYATDEDVDLSMCINEVLYEHSSYLLDDLLRSKPKKNRGFRESKLLKLLPDLFDTSKALEIAQLLGIPERSTYVILKKLSKDGILIKPEKGLYRKAS